MIIVRGPLMVCSRRSASDLLAVAAMVAWSSCAAAAMDLRFDTCTWGVDGFGQTQLDHLCWTSPNGHGIAMPDDAHRSSIDSSGNTYVGYYNTLTNRWGAGETSTQSADTINAYVTAGATHGARPTWLALNEISAGTWPGNASYRAWLRGTVSRLHNTYGYNVILFAPFANPSANGADWAPLSQDCYIGIENYLSGEEMKANGFSVTWAQQQYAASIASYTARGVDASRLILTEDYSQTVAGTGWGRGGVTAAEWQQAIAARCDALRNVGFA